MSSNFKTTVDNYVEQNVITTNISNGSSSSAMILPEYTATISLVFLTSILAIGVLGNLLVIIVIRTSKEQTGGGAREGCSTNLFLLNLSIADLLVLVTCTPSALVEIATRGDAWIMGKILCFSVPYVELSVSHTSVLTILAITVERYYAICLPFKSKAEPCTESRAVFTCLIAWLLAFGLTAPILAMTEYQSDSGSGDSACATKVDLFWQKLYFIIIIIVFFFIPLIILVGLYRSIARHLVPTEEQVVPETAAVLRSRQQVVAMLFTVVMFFFACMMPFKVFTLWFVAAPYDPMTVISGETYYNLLYFARIMFYTNSAINPILYNIMSSKFREGFKKIFRKVTCKNVNERRMLADEFESSASKVHSRRSVTKESSFEVLSHAITENGENIALQGKENTRNPFPKREESIGFASCSDKNHEKSSNDENAKQESILLIEEKQYRLIKAKGHFKI